MSTKPLMNVHYVLIRPLLTCRHGNSLNNLGQIGVLDAYYGTQADWLASWQAHVPRGTYTSPDYPVDKAIAMPKSEAQPLMAA